MRAARRPTLQVYLTWHGQPVGEETLQWGDPLRIGGDGSLGSEEAALVIRPTPFGWRVGMQPTLRHAEQGALLEIGPLAVRMNVEARRLRPPRWLRRPLSTRMARAYGLAALMVATFASIAHFTVEVDLGPLDFELTDRFIACNFGPREVESSEPARRPRAVHPPSAKAKALATHQSQATVLALLGSRASFAMGGMSEALSHDSLSIAASQAWMDSAHQVAHRREQTRRETRALREAEAARREAVGCGQRAVALDRALTDPRGEPVSVLAADVDTAGYGLVSEAIDAGRVPPSEHVRTEELLNAFDDYADPPPRRGALALHLESGPAPWAADRRLLRVSLVAKTPRRRGPANLVIVLDRSGSMGGEAPGGGTRLAMVTAALEGLLDDLSRRDRVTLLSFDDWTKVEWGPARLGDGASLRRALQAIELGGGTDGALALETALARSRETFRRRGVNQILFFTDGGFNQNVTDANALVRTLRRESRRGQYFSFFGVDGRHDRRLETLADRANGFYAHLRSPEDARRLLGDGLAGLQIVARDVKLQLRFDPERVRGYRLLGYENRRLAPEDFRADQVDGGELGAGHHMTALYEVQLAALGRGRAVHATLRYQNPLGEGAHEVAASMTGHGVRAGEASADLQFAAAVAAFADALREGQPSLEEARDWTREAVQRRPTPARMVFLRLVERAAAAQG